MTNPPEQPPVAFELHADPSLTSGVYANMLSVWSTAYEFTLDFSVNSQPPWQAQTEEGGTVIHMPAQLVARVKIPPGAVFEFIRAINQNMYNYEEAWGPIRRPGQDEELYPPSRLGNTGNEPPTDEGDR